MAAATKETLSWPFCHGGGEAGQCLETGLESWLSELLIVGWDFLSNDL